MKPFLKTHYFEQVLPELMKKRGYGNKHEVPRITKVVLNSGFDAQFDKSEIEALTKDMTSIAGQKAVVTRARRSISNFKVREGMPVGVKVTLRGIRMYEFLLRLIAVALPGIRDFRGVPTKLDGNGNYSLGITDHTIFPEITVETNRKAIGLDITICTSAATDDEGRELLTLMGMPFRKKAA